MNKHKFLSDKIALGLVICAMAYAFCLLMSVITAPLGRDEGIFAWVGMRVAAGGLPYSDAWDHKGPLWGFMMAVPIWLFGHSVEALHLLDVLCLCGQMAAVWHLMRPCGVRVQAVALLLTPIAAQLYFSTALQPDAWAGLGGLLLICALQHSTRRAVFLSGFIVGLCCLIKPLYALYGLLIILTYPRLTLYAAAGGAVSLFLVLLPFLWAGQGLAVWQNYILFNLSHQHIAQTSPNYYFPLVSVWFNQLEKPDFVRLLSFDFMVVLAAYGYFWERQKMGLIALLALIGFAISAAQGNIAYYRLVPALLPTFALASIAIVRLLGRYPFCSIPQASLFIVISLAHINASALSNAEIAVFYETISGQRLERDTAELYTYQPATMQGGRQLAAYLNTHSTPEAGFFCLCFDVGVYFMANTMPATRYGFSYPLLVGAGRAERQAEAIAALKAHPPRYIAVQKTDTSYLLNLGSAAQMKDFPAFKAWLDERYKKEQESFDYLLYRLQE